MKHKFAARCMLTLILTVLLCGVAFAGEERVFDYAGMFDSSEIDSLETQIEEFIGNTGMDMVILTTEETEGESSSKYGEQFYIDNNFGIGDNYNGILFLIDMDNRELWIKPVGDMNRYITDDRSDTMLDRAMSDAQNGDFYGAAQGFIEDSYAYYEKGIQAGQYTYEVKEKGIVWYEALIAVAGALLTAFIPCMGIVNEYAMKKSRKQAQNSLMAYRSSCNFAYDSKADDLIDTRVTQAVIPKNTGSSGGQSGGSSGRSTVHTSSGRSFGGGGRKF